MSKFVKLSVAMAFVAFAAAGCSKGGGSSAAAAGAAPTQDSASTNPLIGSWTLATPGDTATCPDQLQFTDTTYTTIWNGVTKNNSVLYHANPGYMAVFVNGDLAHYQQYNLTSANVITNVTGNQYAMLNCAYNRT